MHATKLTSFGPHLVQDTKTTFATTNGVTAFNHGAFAAITAAIFHATARRQGQAFGRNGGSAAAAAWSAHLFCLLIVFIAFDL